MLAESALFVVFIAKDDSIIRYPFWLNLNIDAINNEKHQSQSLDEI